MERNESYSKMWYWIAGMVVVLPLAIITWNAFPILAVGGAITYERSKASSYPFDQKKMELIISEALAKHKLEPGKNSFCLTKALEFDDTAVGHKVIRNSSNTVTLYFHGPDKITAMILTSNLGHAGRYAFFFSQEPIKPRESVRGVRESFSSELMGWEIIEQLNANWWRIYYGLD